MVFKGTAFKKIKKNSTLKRTLLCYYICVRGRNIYDKRYISTRKVSKKN